jgi:hypothetical protein
MTPPSELIYDIMCEIYANGDEGQQMVSNITEKYAEKVELSDVVEGHSFCVKLQRAFEGLIFGGVSVT